MAPAGGSGNGDISLASKAQQRGWTAGPGRLGAQRCAASASSVRARRALHRCSAFGSLLAFLLIDFPAISLTRATVIPSPRAFLSLTKPGARKAASIERHCWPHPAGSPWIA
jgi:hypothetical protein